MLIKICKYLVQHYYYLFVLFSLLIMLKFKDLTSLLILLTISSSILSIVKLKFQPIDLFVLIFILYNLISGFFSEYPYEIYYAGIRNQVIPIMFYFIGRGQLIDNKRFIENIKIPIIISIVFGLYVYFFPPNFYIDFKSQNLTADMNSKMYYEMTRLSSFWGHSYTIGFASLFLSIILLKEIIIDNIGSKKTYLILSLAILTLFFAQQRVSIAFFILVICFFTYYAFKINSPQRYTIIYIIIIIIIITILITTIMLYYLDSGFIDYVLNRTIDNDGNLIGDRIKMFDKYIKQISLFGKGLGLYGHKALSYNLPSITDCDYIRLPNELGYVGLTCFLGICTSAILKTKKILNYTIFEFLVIIFYLIAMIGAAPLYMWLQQPFLLWFSIGSIQKKYLIYRIKK